MGLYIIIGEIEEGNTNSSTDSQSKQCPPKGNVIVNINSLIDLDTQTMTPPEATDSCGCSVKTLYIILTNSMHMPMTYSQIRLQCLGIYMFHFGIFGLLELTELIGLYFKIPTLFSTDHILGTPFLASNCKTRHGQLDPRLIPPLSITSHESRHLPQRT